jgi:polysaccharide export outer membrane protein
MSPRFRSLVRTALGAVALSALVACGGSGQFTWYHDLPKNEWEASNTEYVIGVGDVISVTVYGQDGLGSHGKIRPDGRLSLPLAGEIVAAGKHPSALAHEIEVRLTQFIQAPHVTVSVDETQPVVINVLGEVGHAGSLTLQPPFGLLQAIALAGGVSDYADKSKIFVLRSTPAFRRIRFTYDALVQNQGGAAMFPLRTGDVILVE